MTDTRLVSIDQIAVGAYAGDVLEQMVRQSQRIAERQERQFPIYVRQVGDATGGDVFTPRSAHDAAMIEGLRRAKWPHPVQVEVVT